MQERNIAAKGDLNAEIQILRFIAVFFVICHHIPLFWPILPPFTQAWTGVDLFFVISGYVVTRSFEKDLSQHSNIGRPVGHFYLRRLARIWPALTAFFVAYLAFACEFLWGPGSRITNIIAVSPQIGHTYALILNYILLIPNYGLCYFSYLWSLCIEEHFYLVYPWARTLLKWKYLRMGALALVLLVEVYWIRGKSAYHGLEVRFYTHLHFDGIVAGVLIREIRETRVWERVAQYLANHRKWAIWPLRFSVLASLFAVGYYPKDHEWKDTLNVALVLCSWLVLISSFQQGIITTLWKPLDKALTWLGDRTYGIYLFHILPFSILEGLDARHHLSLTKAGEPMFYVGLASYCVLLVIIVELSYRLVEEPIRIRVRNWTKRRMIAGTPRPNEELLVH